MTAYPYTKISASGAETESTAIVEVTMSDDTGTVAEQDIVDAIKAVLLASPVLDTTSAIRYSITQTAA